MSRQPHCGPISTELHKSYSLPTDNVQVPEEFSGFCYVYEGSGKVGGTKASEQQALVMGKGAPHCRCCLLDVVLDSLSLPVP